VTAALDSWQEHGQSQSPAGGTGTSPWLAGECRPPVGDSTQAAECPARHPACMMMSAQADQPRSRSQVALSTHHHLVLLSDDNLRTHTHINIHCTTRQVRRQIGWEVTQQLVLALIMSRLDYCNSMLAALPTSTLQPLQRVQNAAARLVFGLSRSDHVTPTLIQLHWLPVSYRIKFKLCCHVHAIHYGRSPAYLTETVQSVGASRSRSGLRSSSTSSMDYSLPWPRTKFGERAFSHTGPAT